MSATASWARNHVPEILWALFAAVNFQKVSINFIVGEANAPLVVALLISGGIGFVIGLALPRFRRPKND